MKKTYFPDGVFYRVHITCSARHTSYIDYRTKKYALKYFSDNRDKTDWYAYKVECLHNFTSKTMRAIFKYKKAIDITPRECTE